MGSARARQFESISTRERQLEEEISRLRKVIRILLSAHRISLGIIDPFVEDES